MGSSCGSAYVVSRLRLLDDQQFIPVQQKTNGRNRLHTHGVEQLKYMTIALEISMARPLGRHASGFVPDVANQNDPGYPPTSTDF